MNDTDTVTSNPAPAAKEVLVNSAVQNKIANIVETRLKGGQRVTVVNLAKEMKVSVGEVRNALVEAFGNRVVFKRGRTGGIYLT